MRHGTNAGYVAGCRDDGCCRTAHAAYQRRLWRRHYTAGVTSLMVPALGTRRRLRALMALGWTMPALDAHLGERVTANLLAGRGEVVHLGRARLVAQVYERLCMSVPDGWVAERTRRMAHRRGWRPPLWWDDIDDPRDRAPGPKPQET